MEKGYRKHREKDYSACGKNKKFYYRYIIFLQWEAFHTYEIIILTKRVAVSGIIRYNEFMDEYAWEYHEIREHFIKSAVESEIDSGYSATALYNAAHEQFTQFIAKLEDDASARGYEDGASDSTHGVKADLFAMEQKIALLMEDLEAKTSIEVKRLMHLLKSLRIHKAPPADDVEEWAYQDGWNDIITKLEDSLRGEQVDATPHS